MVLPTGTQPLPAPPLPLNLTGPPRLPSSPPPLLLLSSPPILLLCFLSSSVSWFLYLNRVSRLGFILHCLGFILHLSVCPSAGHFLFVSPFLTHSPQISSGLKETPCHPPLHPASRTPSWTHLGPRGSCELESEDFLLNPDTGVKLGSKSSPLPFRLRKGRGTYTWGGRHSLLTC